MSEDKEIEKEIIEQLIKSKGILGELNEVVYDSDGEILSGRHRIKAGWTLERVVDTEAIAKKFNLPRAFVKEMFRMHFNVQRRPSKEETQRRLLIMAEELVSAGVAKPDVALELAKYVPHSEQYVRELLPDEYKHVEFRHKEKLVSPIVQKRIEELRRKGVPEDYLKEIQEGIKDRIKEFEEQYVHDGEPVKLYIWPEFITPKGSKINVNFLVLKEIGPAAPISVKPEEIQPAPTPIEAPEPENLIRKIIELRDKKLPYKYLYSDITNLPEFTRISYAIDKGKNADEVIALLHEKPPEPTIPVTPEVITRPEQFAEVVKAAPPGVISEPIKRPFVYEFDNACPTCRQRIIVKTFSQYPLDFKNTELELIKPLKQGSSLPEFREGSLVKVEEEFNINSYNEWCPGTHTPIPVGTKGKIVSTNVLPRTPDKKEQLIEIELEGDIHTPLNELKIRVPKDILLAAFSCFKE